MRENIIAKLTQSEYKGHCTESRTAATVTKFHSHLVSSCRAV
jgi:hypothetical protein